MAADYEQMAKNLRQFYPFSGHTVIGVGAGGGPLTAVVCEARKLIVIDNNPAAIRQWEARVAADQLQDRVEIVEADFCTVSPRGDVVYFEFCLHEMDDPALALKHAMTVAPDVVVFDHLPDSEWAFHAAEEDKVRRSTDALDALPHARRQYFQTEQRFQTYQQLVDKVACQGTAALRRAERYSSVSDISIPMGYGLTLLHAGSC